MEHFFGRSAFGHAHFGVLRKKKEERLSFLAKYTFFRLSRVLCCLVYCGME